MVWALTNLQESSRSTDRCALLCTVGVRGHASLCAVTSLGKTSLSSGSCLHHLQPATIRRPLTAIVSERSTESRLLLYPPLMWHVQMESNNFQLTNSPRYRPGLTVVGLRYRHSSKLPVARPTGMLLDI